MAEHLIALCTVPDRKTAERIAERLVGQRLAACVNILPGLTSVYRWQGEVQRDNELLLVIKTQRACFNALEAAVHRLHPYELPEIVAVPIVTGSRRYLAWITENTGPDATT